jgi:hypothetical protein
VMSSMPVGWDQGHSFSHWGVVRVFSALHLMDRIHFSILCWLSFSCIMPSTLFQSKNHFRYG